MLINIRKKVFVMLTNRETDTVKTQFIYFYNKKQTYDVMNK